MYGKIHERKLRENDYKFSCEDVRRQLDEYMDLQNRRVNIDSAKKRAVLQHMDYQGFRQMVLGANIFATKSAVLYNFSKGQDKASMNLNKAFEEKQEGAEMRMISMEVEGNSEKHCFNFRDFKKKFMKFYEKQLNWERAEECYSLAKEQDKSRLEKIFNLECEADILVKIVEVFAFVMDFLRKDEEKNQTLRIQTAFMVKFLQIVLSVPTMGSISLGVVTKKQKEKIANFLLQCKNVLEDESITEIILLLKK